MPNFPALVKGRRYKVRYRVEGLRSPRELVADFLDETDNILHWSGRPVFGTASLHMGHTTILSLTEAAAADCHPPRVVK